MINVKTNIYLLAFPLGLMGIVQATFGALSFFLFQDGLLFDFLLPALVQLVIAVLVFVLVRSRYDFDRIHYRDAFLFAVLTWVMAGVLGAIPILLITELSFSRAVFESVSGLTTTGATMLSGLDQMAPSFLLYRQFLQWLGGLGVVIFVVAVLPMLNVGGMRLLKAETPGPMKDEKLSPRIASTAHYLWIVYMVLTFGCAVGYYLAGMTVFDALAHSLTTVSTGGFSVYDASMGHFNDPVILWVANLFMVLGAISFALHFKAWRIFKPGQYLRDEEARTFLIIVVLMSLLVAWLLLQKGAMVNTAESITTAFFHVISFITSTGYGAGNYTEWPAVVVGLLVFSAYLGGCSGSTAGGNKIIRNILSIKLINLEIKRLIHPRGVFLVKYQNQPVDAKVTSATIMFMVVAAVSSMLLTIVMMFTGLDFWSSMTAVAACLNVLGPAFGELGSNFQPVSEFGTWVLVGAMILGRLEYMTVFALFSLSFWRR